MRRFTPDPVSFRAHHLHLFFRPTDLVISSGSGFVYQRHESLYLITNWHNVAGRNPETGQCLSETLAIPDIVSLPVRLRENPGNWQREQIRLYSDNAMQNPAWLVHPTLRQKVDVVALPLRALERDQYRFFPINAVEFDDQFPTVVGDDAFVVGYPFHESPDGQWPIWKRASIATEPQVDVDGLPKLLIDTATRPGLSGSPVLMQRSGLHGVVGLKLAPDTLIGTIRNFIGIYSGRVGADEVRAQLGIVWKKLVIDEIIDGATLGRANEA